MNSLFMVAFAEFCIWIYYHIIVKLRQELKDRSTAAKNLDRDQKNRKLMRNFHKIFFSDDAHFLSILNRCQSYYI